MWILFLNYLPWSGIARIQFDWINCSWTFLAYWNARIIRLSAFTLKVLRKVLMRKEEKYYSVSQERRPATVNCCVILISLWFRCFKELVVVSTITLLKCCTYFFMQEGKMKIKSTLLNNCERQLQLNSQVSDCSWRCWIHRFQAAFLDETIGSQHQLLLNICFAGTSYSKLYPFYKSEVQLLLIFSNSHHCICRWFFRIAIC